jgi:hypothetical protein
MNWRDAKRCKCLFMPHFATFVNALTLAILAGRVARLVQASPAQDQRKCAQMAELVDALVSGISGAIRGGSSPLLGTSWYSEPSVQDGVLFHNLIANDAAALLRLVCYCCS